MNPLLLALTLQAPANFNYAPAERAVFVDFTHATYTVTLNPLGRVGSTVQSVIELEQGEEGHLIFDLKRSPDEMMLDGVAVSSSEISTPHGETNVRVVNLKSLPGKHTLTISSKLNAGYLFPTRAELYFKMRDLHNREFLEQYLPTNLEYDQYRMTLKLNLNLPGASRFTVMSNAESASSSGEGSWNLEFPSYFNASSVFLHVFPTPKYEVLTSSFFTSSGRVIPITIYGNSSQNLKAYEQKALAVLTELEKNYGEYAHPHLVLYAQGNGGGMEYDGAAETSLISLGHEMFHSYFGRGVKPTNGNTGCLDEALASWRDYDYFQTEKPNFSSGNICGHSEYARKTDKHSYKEGREFFAFIDSQLKNQGGLKSFLKYFYSIHVHQTVTIEQFRDELNQFTQSNFSPFFSRFLLGGPS